MSEEPFPSFRPAVHHPSGPLGRCLWFAVRGRDILVTLDYQLKTQETLLEIGLEPVRTQYLGLLDELHCFSAELPAEAGAPDGFRFADLRSLFGHFDGWLHSLAGRAVQVVDWERSHQFCGECGGPTEHQLGERARRCPACRRVFYPRLAPSMIVSVERGDEILLGRSPHFPPGIYSVLAGFVEPGESLEECVVREVREETGIEVTDVRYFSSQPWPFPNSLMIGFTARYASGEVVPDGVEMEEAAFFAYDDLPKTFPGNISISQWLLNDFVARKRRGE